MTHAKYTSNSARIFNKGKIYKQLPKFKAFFHLICIKNKLAPGYVYKYTYLQNNPMAASETHT